MRQNDKVVCGIDIHKKFLVVALLTAMGEYVIERFTNNPPGLLKLKDWLIFHDCELVAAESTGVYWFPLFLTLEGYVNIIIANARQIKAIPGRKTDIIDAQWIATLALNGLIKPSRIFCRSDRELRKLTRARQKLTQERTDHKNRIHQILESVGIKLSSVLTDIFGKAGQYIVRKLLEGTTVDEIIEHIPVAQIRKKKAALLEALNNNLSSVDKLLLEQHLDMIKIIDGKIAEIDSELMYGFKDRKEDLDILTSIPGIGQTSAVTILAEIGNFNDFPSAEKLAAWTGIVPSVYQSAEKYRTGRITKQGSRQLRWILIEVAHSAARTKHSHFHQYFTRMKRKVGYQKAVVALAHTVLRVIWHLLHYREHYVDPISSTTPKKEFPNPENLQRRERSAIQLLTRLNYVVTKPTNELVVHEECRK